MRPLLMTLGDYRNLSLNGAKRLSYLTQLFPSSFNEKLCEQLLQHLKKLLEVAILAHKGNWTTRHILWQGVVPSTAQCSGLVCGTEMPIEAESQLQ
jgi:hypothetical protein